MRLCSFEVGTDQPFFLIAGPCVIESESLVLNTATALARMTAELGIPFIFKASYDKANRTSHASYRGPGLEQGLRILARVRDELGARVAQEAVGRPHTART